MKALYATIAVIYLVLAVNSSSIYANNPVKIVVIDAGHGGNDPGAIGISGVKEKDITLAIALKLGALIEKNTSIKVVYTRKTDVFLELHKRSQVANNNHADYFISIHCNSVEKNNVVSGAETFVMGLSKSESNLAIAQKENSAILNEQDHESNYDGFDPTSPEAYILFTIYQNAYRNQSIGLAAAIQAELKTLCKRADRGVKEAGFLVLWRSAMPSVLVEAGFLSNKEEEIYLASEKGQTELALAIYNGLAKTAQIEPLKMSQVSEFIDTVVPVSVRSSYPIAYRVQFLTASKEMKKTAPELKNLPDIMIEKVGNAYKYTAGNFATRPEAITLLAEVKKVGFPDAFIVTAKNETGVFTPSSNANAVSETKIKGTDIVQRVDEVKNIEKVDKTEPVAIAKTVSEPNVMYKIQFLTSSNVYKVSDPRLKNLPDIAVEKAGNINKYLSGKCTTYGEAKTLLDKAKEAGFSDAFMVAYGKDGQRITIREAKELENKK